MTLAKKIDQDHHPVPDKKPTASTHVTREKSVRQDTDNLISVSNVTKTYGTKVALSDVNLEFRRGETTVLMGPNGAGKTTLMEILCGLHTPDMGGEIRAFGQNIALAPEEHRVRIGVQLQETQLFARATAREYLNFFRALYPRSLALEDISSWLSLDSYLDLEIRKLSGGMAQRVALALAVINDPEIILLDEPTIGLDPISRRSLWACLQQLKKREKTLIFTTHYMDEAVSLADRVIMLADGRVVFNGTPAQIKAKVQELSYSLDDVFAHYVNRVKE